MAMAEVGKAENIKVDNTPEIVAVGKDQVGYVWRTPGQYFELSGIFGDTSVRSPHEGKIARVYFRTENNIYALSNQGQYVDLNESVRTGQIHVQYLNTERLKNAKVFVGEKFAFSPQIITDKIIEIVAVTSNSRNPKDLYSRTGGKKNSIVENFTKNIPK